MSFHNIKKFFEENSPVSWGLLFSVLFGAITILVTASISIFATKGQAQELDKRITGVEQCLPPINQQLGHIAGKIDENYPVLEFYLNNDTIIRRDR
ncbi:MAG: LapA family protein [Nitrosotalea sp.]